MDPDMLNNIQTVLALFYLIWIYGWAKNQLGSAKLAILFAVIVVYLTFFHFPDLIWVPVVIFIFAFFGKGLFERLSEGEKLPDHYKE